MGTVRSGKGAPPASVMLVLRSGIGGLQRLGGLTDEALQRHASVGTVRRVEIGDSPSRSPRAWIQHLRTLTRFWLMSRRCTHVVFNDVGLARLLKLPGGSSRPSLVWICGVEVWGEGTQDRARIARTRATRILSISHFTRDVAATFHPEWARARVCHPGTVPSIRASAPLAPSARNRRALILGRMQRGRDKGHRATLLAWSRLPVSLQPLVSLEVVGDGDDMAAIMEIADRLGLSNVTFHGTLSDEAVGDLMRSSRAMVMPSSGEGFGLVYIEAMAFGTPVICSREDAGQEVVEHGSSGYCVRKSDIDALSEAIRTLLTDDAVFELMSIAAYQRWESDYGFDPFFERFGAEVRALVSSTVESAAEGGID